MFYLVCIKLPDNKKIVLRHFEVESVNQMVENTVETEENADISIFFFSHFVFKSHPSLTEN